MTDQIWRVVVRRELSVADKEALQRRGATYIGGHSGPGWVSRTVLVRAGDEATARSVVESVLGEQALIDEATLMPVFVHAVIPEEARTAFEAAAKTDTRVGAVTQREPSGHYEIQFELLPSEIDGVLSEAREIYETILTEQGVPVPEPLEMTLSGFDVFLGAASRDRQLLAQARELLESDEPELAVVLAQTACELVIADAIRNLMVVHISDELRPWAFGRTKSFSLIDDPTRDLWYRLSGSAIQSQTFWSTYRAHVTRRNQVIHEGRRVESSEAQDSVSVADALFEYVERVAGAGRSDDDAA